MEGIQKSIEKITMAETCAFLCVENDNIKCWICNRELQKKKRFKN